MENKMVSAINQSEYKNLTSCPLCSNGDFFTVLQNPTDKVLHTESFNSQIDLCKKCSHAFPCIYTFVPQKCDVIALQLIR